MTQLRKKAIEQKLTPRQADVGFSNYYRYVQESKEKIFRRLKKNIVLMSEQTGPQNMETIKRKNQMRIWELKIQKLKYKMYWLALTADW